MPKKDMIELVETLASIGYEIVSFDWKGQKFDSPYTASFSPSEQIDLKILKTYDKEKKSSNPAS